MYFPVWVQYEMKLANTSIFSSARPCIYDWVHTHYHMWCYAGHRYLFYYLYTKTLNYSGGKTRWFLSCPYNRFFQRLLERNTSIEKKGNPKRSGWSWWNWKALWVPRNNKLPVNIQRETLVRYICNNLILWCITLMLPSYTLILVDSIPYII